VLVSAHDGKRDAERHRLSGRAEDSRLVHFDVPAGSATPRPGDIVTVRISEAASFHLVADAPVGESLQIRRTRSGDAWDRAEAASCGVPAPAGGASEPGRVSLGLPSLRVGPASRDLGLTAVSRVSTTPIYDELDGQR